MTGTPQSMLEARVRAAVDAVFGAVTLPDAVVLPAKDARNGDYSSPVAMSLAKQLGRKPLDIAGELAAAIDAGDLLSEVTVAPPGFVNLRIAPAWLSSRVGALRGDDRAGVEPAATKELVVVDYSSPNMAKAMHVGHLRSTIIGDALARIYEHLGHTIDRVNHIGDYGAQFGMLLVHVEDQRATNADLRLADVEDFYRAANKRSKEDPDFFERSRRRVVDLQAGEPTAVATWREYLDMTRRANQPVYDLLGIVGLEERGESFYEPMLPSVVDELEAKGLLVEDRGARVVYVPGYTNREGDPLPLIVVNQHGGYGYATTDLAAIRHRTKELGADRILYVVAADQNQHLTMVFEAARMAGWVSGQLVEHIGFGLVLGEDNRKLSTRTGDSPKLADLLSEAIDKAKTFVVARAEERQQPVPDDVEEIARVIGIGAVKYADLSQNRQSNYVFSYDKMLSLKGNTAPYLQYAYARMRSILREGGAPAGDVVLNEQAELDLAKTLVSFPDALERVVAEHEPNHLCAHLFDVAQAFSRFYEACPVLKAGDPVRSSRLALCEVSAATLRSGLSLLGIDVLERL